MSNNKNKSNNRTKNTDKEQEQKKEKHDDEDIQDRIEKEKHDDDRISEFGEVVLDGGENKRKIHLLTIIGEIEGHDVLSGSSKTTKYEHVLPQLAKIEHSDDTDGLMLLINTMGGDVEAGLAIAEMISSLSKPTVSLVLGGSHSIGVPIAVSTDYSFIVPTGTMVIHPVRMNGMFIGAPQTYDYFKLMQDRIVGFISSHADIRKDRIEELMLNKGILTKDLGTILVGTEAVNEGLINEVGGMKEAMKKLYALIDKSKAEKIKK